MNLPSKKKRKSQPPVSTEYIACGFIFVGEGGRGMGSNSQVGWDTRFQTWVKDWNVVKIIVFRAKEYSVCYSLESLVTIDVVE